MPTKRVVVCQMAKIMQFLSLSSLMLVVVGPRVSLSFVTFKSDLSGEHPEVPDVKTSETCIQSSETKASIENQESMSNVQLRTDRQNKHRADLVLSASPPMLVNSYADTLELMCQYKNSPFVHLSSMSILHSLSLEKPEFKYMYSVNIYNNEGQSNVPSLRNTSGAIDNRGGSFLKLIIDDQTVNKIGLYKCEVIGFDAEQGEPVIVSKDVVVKSSRNVLDSVIEIFQNKTHQLKESIELLQSKTNIELEMKNNSLAIKKLEIDFNKSISEIRLDNEQTKKVMANMIKLNDELKNNYQAVKKTLDEVVAQLKKFESDPKSLFQKSLESLFIASDIFRGRRYWLTRQNYRFHVTDAHMMCLRYGGYLVEIDSQDEFNFVRAFIQKNKTLWAIFTGGTDSVQEGLWVNRFSLLKKNIFNWYKGEPSNSGNEEHCECFLQPFDYRMNDCRCNFEDHNSAGFICEIHE